MNERTKASPEQIEEARRLYADDDLAIDDDADLSPIPPEQGGGYWVSAWVYIDPDEESPSDE